MWDDDEDSGRMAELRARTGLSARDLDAFIEAWRRAGSHGTLEEFLGFVPRQRDGDDGRRQATS